MMPFIYLKKKEKTKNMENFLMAFPMGSELNANSSVRNEKPHYWGFFLPLQSHLLHFFLFQGSRLLPTLFRNPDLQVWVQVISIT